MAEGLNTDAEFLGADLVILNNPTIGFRVNLFGIWNPVYEDFFEYSLIKKSYIEPIDMTLDKKSQFIHSLNFGTNYIYNKKVKIGSKISFHQLSMIKGARPHFTMDYPWVYGAGANLHYQLYKSDFSLLSIRFSGIFYLPQKGSDYKINSAFIYDIEAEWLKRVSKTGFHIGGRFHFELNDVVLNNTEISRKEMRIGLLVEKDI